MNNVSTFSIKIPNSIAKDLWFMLSLPERRNWMGAALFLPYALPAHVLLVYEAGLCPRNWKKQPEARFHEPKPTTST